MSTYAKGTEVPVEKSRAEIERLLQKRGADQVLIGWQRTGEAAITFRMRNRYVRLHLSLPSADAKEFKLTPQRRFLRHAEDAHKAWEQACRERWRALLLVLRAKLEAEASGITSFEEEFLAHFLLPGDRRVSEIVLPAVAQAYETGKMQPLLPSFASNDR